MARGSVEKRLMQNGKPRYRGRIDHGRDPLTGKRKIESKTFRTKDEAHAWVNETLSKMARGEYVKPSMEPLGPYLDHWLATRAELAPKTRRNYSDLIRLHIVPALGSTAIGRVTPRAIQALYNQFTGRPTAFFLHTVLRQALDQAVAEGLIPRNPTERLRVPLPKPDRARVMAWDGEQLVTFLHAAESSRYHACYVLLAASGLRLGEALNLTWRDIDLDQQTVSVRGQTKTATSRRTIPLDAETIDVLRTHQQEQRARLRAFDILVTDGTPVIDGGAGNTIRVSVIDADMKRIVQSTGLPPLTPHGLRHSHATALLIAGRPIHYVARRLGHSSPVITLSIYAHLLPNTEHADADAYAAMIAAARAEKQPERKRA